MTIRILTKEDIPQAKLLWGACFPEDDDNFINWYFSTIFSEGYGYFLDNVLVSMVCISKRTLHVRGKDVYCALVQGVCTAADHRRKGYSYETLRYALKSVRSDCSVAILTTYEPYLYYKSGFATYLRTGLAPVVLQADDTCLSELHLTESLKISDARQCAQVFNDALAGYSGWLKRNEQDMLNKFCDQCQHGDDAMHISSVNGEITGFVFSENKDNLLIISEAIGDAKKLICSPSDKGIVCMQPSSDGTLYSMIRILDFEKAFEQVTLPSRDLSIYVSDDFLEENRKVWHIYSTRNRTRILETSADPENELDISTVSALFIGATEEQSERYADFYQPRMQLECY